MQNEQLSKQLFVLLMNFPKQKRKKVLMDGLFPGDIAIFHLLQHKRAEENICKVKMSDISKSMNFSKPAATQAIDRLVEHGLVKRTSDANDRRTVYIEVTQKGCDQFQTAFEQSVSFMDRVINRMGYEDAKNFALLFEKFQNAVKDEFEESEVCRNV